MRSRDAFRPPRRAVGWTVLREREDVCPVVTLPEGVDFEGYLDTLDKKARHEIRRKIRRAEAAGEVALTESTDPLADLDDVHRPPPGALGRARAVPAEPGRRREPGVHPPPVRGASDRTGRSG